MFIDCNAKCSWTQEKIANEKYIRHVDEDIGLQQCEGSAWQRDENLVTMLPRATFKCYFCHDESVVKLKIH